MSDGRVLILTPDPAGEWADSRWPAVLERLRERLEPAGLDVETRPWTAAEPLPGDRLSLPLLAWGYHRDGDWQGTVGRWTAQGARLANPAAVLGWNADKTYMRTLEAKGAPVVPTHYVDKLDEAALHAAAAAFGTDRLVTKPQVSGGAFQTIRWSSGTPLDDAPDGAAMIQPYLPSIETEGEVSLLFFGGRFSHAISKRPQPGDFRVQPEYDGIIAAHQPSADELDAAERVLAAVDEPLLYARVDLVRGLDGAPALMELELIEPDLYLQYAEDGGRAFAEAVQRACPSP